MYVVMQQLPTETQKNSVCVFVCVCGSPLAYIALCFCFKASPLAELGLLGKLPSCILSQANRCEDELENRSERQGAELAWGGETRVSGCWCRSGN